MTAKSIPMLVLVILPIIFTIVYNGDVNFYIIRRIFPESYNPSSGLPESYNPLSIVSGLYIPDKRITNTIRHEGLTYMVINIHKGNVYV